MAMLQNFVTFLVTTNGLLLVTAAMAVVLAGGFMGIIHWHTIGERGVIAGVFLGIVALVATIYG
jgi:hypothetical protein